MQKRRFIQCDVFSSIPTKGNGLAVVIDGEGLSEIQMQEFAAWTNLAETTFLFPPTDENADYKVRIFTTNREMLFAGHPTLGSCASWLHVGGEAKQKGLVRQECGIGIVEIDISGDVPAFVAPPTKISALEKKELNSLINTLNIDPKNVVNSARLENGPIWKMIELTSANDVLDVASSLVSNTKFGAIGLIGRYDEGSECNYEVRMLSPTNGMSEDPITGSLNSAIACWLSVNGRLKEDIVISQGTKIGRQGRVYIRLGKNKEIYIGGETQILIEGVLEL